MPAPMPTTGRFVWHELHTTDRGKAIAFYTKLLAWETKDVSMGPGEPYSLSTVNGKEYAGITKSKAPASVPSHWVPYVAVEDVDTWATKAKDLGGKILNPPMDIPNVGRFAVIADPQGAVFALFKDPKSRELDDAPSPVGAFCWEEVMTSDPEAAAKFYVGLFGYTVETMDMGTMGSYRLLKCGDRRVAGIMKMAEMPRANWLEYIRVADVDASTRNAKELGAQVLVSPTDIPKIGRFSVLSDPTGAAIGLYKPV